MNYKKRAIFGCAFLTGAALTVVGCKASSSDTSTAASPTPTPTSTPAGPVDNNPADDGAGFAVVGSLNLSTALAAGKTITHVMALNTESNFAYATLVDPVTGYFKLPLSGEISKYIKSDGTVDRERLTADNPDSAADIAGMTDAELIQAITKDDPNPDEATPWIVAYIDATKVGAEMLVSRFGSETLDTLSPVASATGRLQLGDVDAVADGQATVDATYEDVLAATEMSTETASAIGAIDDVSLRYINPDINNDGVLDMPIRDAAGVVTGTRMKFGLDFHNRFNLVGPDMQLVGLNSLKNKFVDEALGGLANVRVNFTGTGISPELEKDLFSGAPATYKWKLDGAVDLNHSATCAENPSATTVPAGTWCTQTYTENVNYSRYQLGIEVKLPPEGTYTLEASGKTFTWTNVKVSDFNGGVGFVALFVKYIVDEKNTVDTTDDVMTGLAYKYMQRTATSWVPATDETLKLLIKGSGGKISMHFEEWSKECGIDVAKSSTGTLNFESLHCENVDQTTMDDLAAGRGILWSRFTGAGVSYDDKLGMRFFF